MKVKIGRASEDIFLDILAGRGRSHRKLLTSSCGLES